MPGTAVPAYQLHGAPFVHVEPPPPPPLGAPTAFGTPIAFPQVTVPLHVPHAVHAHLPPGPPLAPPPSILEPPPPPPPTEPVATPVARAPPLTDAEVKAAASAALSKFMKDIPEKSDKSRRSLSHSRSRKQSKSKHSKSKSKSKSRRRSRSKRSSSRRSRSRSRRRSRGRKRSKSRRKKRSRSREKRSSLVEPPPIPGAASAPSATGAASAGSEKRSKWDEAKAPAWMQDMVEALKSSDAPAAPAPAAPKHKNDPDRPKGQPGPWLSLKTTCYQELTI